MTRCSTCQGLGGSSFDGACTDCLGTGFIGPECTWCRQCGSCDAGLPMSCTCGPCTCADRCGHPRCARGWTPPGAPSCRTCNGRGVLTLCSQSDPEDVWEEPCPDCPRLTEGSQS